jgi:hypothetical protein
MMPWRSSPARRGVVPDGPLSRFPARSRACATCLFLLALAACARAPERPVDLGVSAVGLAERLALRGLAVLVMERGS